MIGQAGRYYKGFLTFEGIMNMPWITFKALYDDAIEYEKEQVKEMKRQSKKRK